MVKRTTRNRKKLSNLEKFRRHIIHLYSWNYSVSDLSHIYDVKEKEIRECLQHHEEQRTQLDQIGSKPNLILDGNI